MGFFGEDWSSGSEFSPIINIGGAISLLKEVVKDLEDYDDSWRFEKPITKIEFIIAELEKMKV